MTAVETRPAWPHAMGDIDLSALWAVLHPARPTVIGVPMERLGQRLPQAPWRGHRRGARPRGITQKRLAVAVERSTAAVSRWEGGKSALDATDARADRRRALGMPSLWFAQPPQGQVTMAMLEVARVVEEGLGQGLLTPAVKPVAASLSTASTTASATFRRRSARMISRVSVTGSGTAPSSSGQPNRTGVRFQYGYPRWRVAAAMVVSLALLAGCAPSAAPAPAPTSRPALPPPAELSDSGLRSAVVDNIQALVLGLRLVPLPPAGGRHAGRGGARRRRVRRGRATGPRRTAPAATSWRPASTTTASPSASSPFRHGLWHGGGGPCEPR